MNTHKTKELVPRLALNHVVATGVATTSDYRHVGHLIGLDDYAVVNPLSKSFNKELYSKRKSYLTAMSDFRATELPVIDNYDRTLYILDEIAKRMVLEHKEKFFMISRNVKNKEKESDVSENVRSYKNYYLD